MRKSRSRLQEHLQKQAIKNIVLVIFGAIIVGLILIFFGVQILIKLSMSLDKNSNAKDNPANYEEDVAYIAPPVLNPMSEATNSAKINISGYSTATSKVNLYLNGKVIAKTEVKENKSFIFKDVTLENGSNEIKAKSVAENNKESNYSGIISVTYNNKAPALDLSFPGDGQTFSKDQNQITVNGKTDAGNKVTVNEFWAIVDDQGQFTYNMKLQNGENKIKVLASDDAGNNTTKEIKVNYSQ